MNGLIVQHRTYGYGKVIAMNPAGAQIRFCGANRVANFGLQAFRNGDLSHARLLVETAARGPRGLCVIFAVPPPQAEETSLYTYVVKYDDGLTDSVSEIELTPLVSVHAATAVGKLSSFAPCPTARLLARERFITALSALSRQVGGLRALTGSRIDLYPHQAYVAGMVMLDPRRRFILADEVGLGKTIEAGVVIHDLLTQRPESLVLVLTPGALCRQWLCEMHSSFGGQEFRLLDLHPPELADVEHWRRLICSTALALQSFMKRIEAIEWDIVVIDEVHHILDMPVLYEWVLKLARKSRDLLLLSALPARSAEGELLKLLELLEPDRYAPGQLARERFAELYESQAMISRRVNRLAREIGRLRGGSARPGDVVELIENLIQIPTLREDPILLKKVEESRTDPLQVAEVGTSLCEEVIERYRINRRIFRNRRARLIEDQYLQQVRRTVQCHTYAPSQAEIEANEAVQRLLNQARDAECPLTLLRPVTRLLLLHLSSPSLLRAFLQRMSKAKGAELPAKATDFLQLTGVAGYDRWELMEDVICAGARHYLTAAQVTAAAQAADLWMKSSGAVDRIRALTDLLIQLRATNSKVLVFAGLRGFADEAAAAFEASLGKSQVTRFTASLSDDIKEENVRRFRQSDECWLLVSDETGGEGRNFQFVDALVHADLPWSVATVEQRIGRLDRLGRQGDVPSHVLLCSASIEMGWLTCLQEGFRVFSESISGIEFALRSQQNRCLDAAIDGIDELAALAPQLAEECEQERAADQANGLVDEASFRGMSTTHFLRASEPGTDEAVEQGFVGYFRSIASERAATPYTDSIGAKDVWKFRADQVHSLDWSGRENGEDEAASTRVGTFNRSVARLRRDLEFFCFGNPLFDAIARAAYSRALGRSFAVTIAGSGITPCSCIDVQICPEPDPEPLAQDSGLVNRAARVIERRRIGVLVRLDSLEALTDGPHWEAVGRVRRGELKVKDLSVKEMHAVLGMGALEWSELLHQAIDVAKATARGQLAVSIDAAIEAECELMERHRRSFGQGDNQLELSRFAALEKAIRGWDCRVDTVGLAMFA